MNTVYVNKAFDDLIPGFLNKRRQDILMLKEKLGNADIEGIKFIAHCINGSSGSYGFEELSRLAAEIESKALNSSLQELEDLCGLMEKYIDRIQIIFIDE